MLKVILIFLLAWGVFGNDLTLTLAGFHLKSPVRTFTAIYCRLLGWCLRCPTETFTSDFFFVLFHSPAASGIYALPADYSRSWKRFRDDLRGFDCSGRSIGKWLRNKLRVPNVAHRMQTLTCHHLLLGFHIASVKCTIGRNYFIHWDAVYEVVWAPKSAELRNARSWNLILIENLLPYHKLISLRSLTAPTQQNAFLDHDLLLIFLFPQSQANCRWTKA